MHDGCERQIVMASRTLEMAERGYAQLAKRGLIFVIRCEEVPRVIVREVIHLDNRSLANNQTIRPKDRHSCISCS